MALVLGLQLVQAAALLLHVHPLWISNLVQILLPIIALKICLRRRKEDRATTTTKDWTMLAVAFWFWSAAEALYLIELYILPSGNKLTWPDDVLWLFFGLPILLATSGSPDGEKTPFRWLDHGQAFLFCVILLVSVFCIPHIFPFNLAYNAQNVALLLSCCLRSSVTNTRPRRVSTGTFRCTSCCTPSALELATLYRLKAGFQEASSISSGPLP